MFEVSKFYDRYCFLIERANSFVIYLEFAYSILAISFIIDIARPSYLAGNGMSLHSTLLAIWPPDIAGMNLFALVSSIVENVAKYQELLEENMYTYFWSPKKAAYAAWGSISAI